MRMIALVSDQRMQNIIPLIQDRASYEELVLILSKERGHNQPARRFVEAVNDMTAVITALRPGTRVRACEQYIDPYDIQSSKAIVGSLIHPIVEQSSAIVNISGGTKPMAIGALQAAQAAETPCVYTDTENGELIWLEAGGSTRAEKFDLKDLSVASYIRAYGERVKHSDHISQLDPLLIGWADTIVAHYEIIYKNVIVQVMRHLKDRTGGYPIVAQIQATRRQKQVIAELARQGLWAWDDASGQIAVATRHTADFINGRWVEVCVARQLQLSGVFQDICMNVTLHGVEGEIDIAAISGAKLVLVECKSNLKHLQQLGALVAFRNRLGGPFAHAYYARAANDYQRQILAQCAKHRLDGVFFGVELRTLGQAIADRM